MKLACYLLGHEDEVRRSDLLMACRHCGMVAPDWAQDEARRRVTEAADRVAERIVTTVANAIDEFGRAVAGADDAFVRVLDPISWFAPWATPLRSIGNPTC